MLGIPAGFSIDLKHLCSYEWQFLPLLRGTIHFFNWIFYGGRKVLKPLCSSILLD
jgi:hypothetical protein